MKGTVLTMAAGVAGCWNLFMPMAVADVPPALDRVPANAPLVIGVPNVGRLESGIDWLQKTFDIPMDDGPMGHFTHALSLEGLNKEGSAAMAVVPGPDGSVDFNSDTPPMVAIIPVSDYAKFVTSLEGDPNAPVAEVKEGFCRNLGNGFAALGPMRELVEGFQGEPGQGAAHAKLLGKAGMAVAESSDLFVFANIPALAPQIEEGVNEAMAQMDAAMQMAGQDAAAQMELLKSAKDAFVRDAACGIFGFSIGEAGIKADLAAQFRDGTQMAGYFNAAGRAGAMFDRVPALPYLFAVSVDTSSPGIKQALKKMSEASAKMMPQGEDAAGMTATMLKSLDTMDGMAFVFGTSPALMGGMFVNTYAYIRTSDPDGYLATMKQGMAEMNGKTMQGMTYQTTYTPGAKQVGGVAVDEWSMKMQADPNNENAQQMQMMQMSLFGMEGGPSGYVAKAEGGVAVTYSKNSPLMEQCLAAAKGTNTLGADTGIKQVAATLPPDRVTEGYIGVKSILEVVMGFAAMMGGGAPDFQVPGDLPPVGFSGTAAGGGFRVGVAVPTAVLTAVKEFGEAMGGGMGADAPANQGAGQPRF